MKLAVALTVASIAVMTAAEARADSTMPAQVCASDTGTDRAMCVAMIGAERSVLNDGKTVCSNVAPEDLSDTHAIIDFIRAHPEQQQADLGDVAEQVLKKLHPCN